METVRYGNPYREIYLKNKEIIKAIEDKIPKQGKTGKKPKSNYKTQQLLGLLDKLNNLQ